MFSVVEYRDLYLGNLVQIRRADTEQWQVTYGGFATSTNPELRTALADACGAHADKTWVTALEKTVRELAVVERTRRNARTGV